MNYLTLPLKLTSEVSYEPPICLVRIPTQERYKHNINLGEVQDLHRTDKTRPGIFASAA